MNNLWQPSGRDTAAVGLRQLDYSHESVPAVAVLVLEDVPDLVDCTPPLEGAFGLRCAGRHLQPHDTVCSLMPNACQWQNKLQHSFS